MAIYMEFKDGSIKGNVTAEGFEEQLELLSCQWGAGRALTMETGRMSNREATRPSISEVTVSKYLDKSSPLLFEQACIGKEGKDVIVRVVQTGGDTIEAYVEYTLTNCLLASYSVSCSGDGEPLESLSLSFDSIELNYIDQDQKNKTKGSTRWGYSIAKGKKL